MWKNQLTGEYLSQSINESKAAKIKSTEEEMKNPRAFNGYVVHKRQPFNLWEITEEDGGQPKARQLHGLFTSFSQAKEQIIRFQLEKAEAKVTTAARNKPDAS